MDKVHKRTCLKVFLGGGLRLEIRFLITFLFNMYAHNRVGILLIKSIQLFIPLCEGVTKSDRKC